MHIGNKSAQVCEDCTRYFDLMNKMFVRVHYKFNRPRGPNRIPTVLDKV